MHRNLHEGVDQMFGGHVDAYLLLEIKTVIVLHIGRVALGAQLSGERVGACTCVCVCVCVPLCVCASVCVCV